MTWQQNTSTGLRTPGHYFCCLTNPPGLHGPTHFAIATVGVKAEFGLIQVPAAKPTGDQVRIRNEWTASTPLDLHQNGDGLLVKHPQVLGDGTGYGCGSWARCEAIEGRQQNVRIQTEGLGGGNPSGVFYGRRVAAC